MKPPTLPIHLTLTASEFPERIEDLLREIHTRLGRIEDRQLDWATTSATQDNRGVWTLEEQE